MQPWEKGFFAGSAVVVAAVAAWPVLIWYEVRRCEKPKYSVIRPLVGSSTSWWSGKANAELRQYAPYIVAETRIKGADMKQAANTGFRRVAGYIFGGNTSGGSSSTAGSEKIAMTAPVIMQQQQQQQQQPSNVAAESEKIAMTSPVVMQADEQGGYSLAFVMPSKYSLQSLPQPHSSEVQLREVPGYRAAALAFSGHIRGEEVVRHKEQELLSRIQAEGLEAVGAPKLLQYHPPFAPGWMRRNEVLCEVREA